MDLVQRISALTSAPDWNTRTPQEKNSLIVRILADAPEFRSLSAAERDDILLMIQKKYLGGASKSAKGAKQQPQPPGVAKSAQAAAIQQTSPRSVPTVREEDVKTFTKRFLETENPNANIPRQAAEALSKDPHDKEWVARLNKMHPVSQTAILRYAAHLRANPADPDKLIERRAQEAAEEAVLGPLAAKTPFGVVTPKQQARIAIARDLLIEGHRPLVAHEPSQDPLAILSGEALAQPRQGVLPRVTAPGITIAHAKGRQEAQKSTGTAKQPVGPQLFPGLLGIPAWQQQKPPPFVEQPIPPQWQIGKTAMLNVEPRYMYERPLHELTPEEIRAQDEERRILNAPDLPWGFKAVTSQGKTKVIPSARWQIHPSDTPVYRMWNAVFGPNFTEAIAADKSAEGQVAYGLIMMTDPETLPLYLAGTGVATAAFKAAVRNAVARGLLKNTHLIRLAGWAADHGLDVAFGAPTAIEGVKAWQRGDIETAKAMAMLSFVPYGVFQASRLGLRGARGINERIIQGRENAALRRAQVETPGLAYGRQLTEAMRRREAVRSAEASRGFTNELLAERERASGVPRTQQTLSQPAAAATFNRYRGSLPRQQRAELDAQFTFDDTTPDAVVAAAGERAATFGRRYGNTSVGNALLNRLLVSVRKTVGDIAPEQSEAIVRQFDEGVASHGGRARAETSAVDALVDARGALLSRGIPLPYGGEAGPSMRSMKPWEHLANHPDVRVRALAQAVRSLLKLSAGNYVDAIPDATRRVAIAAAQVRAHPSNVPSPRDTPLAAAMQSRGVLEADTFTTPDETNFYVPEYKPALRALAALDKAANPDSPLFKQFVEAEGVEEANRFYKYFIGLSDQARQQYIERAQQAPDTRQARNQAVAQQRAAEAAQRRAQEQQALQAARGELVGTLISGQDVVRTQAERRAAAAARRQQAQAAKAQKQAEARRRAAQRQASVARQRQIEAARAQRARQDVLDVAGQPPRRLPAPTRKPGTVIRPGEAMRAPDLLPRVAAFLGKMEDLASRLREGQRRGTGVNERLAQRVDLISRAVRERLQVLVDARRSNQVGTNDEWVAAHWRALDDAIKEHAPHLADEFSTAKLWDDPNGLPWQLTERSVTPTETAPAVSPLKRPTSGEGTGRGRGRPKTEPIVIQPTVEADFDPNAIPADYVHVRPGAPLKSENALEQAAHFAKELFEYATALEREVANRQVGGPLRKSLADVPFRLRLLAEGIVARIDVYRGAAPVSSIAVADQALRRIWQQFRLDQPDNIINQAYKQLGADESIIWNGTDSTGKVWLPWEFTAAAESAPAPSKAPTGPEPTPAAPSAVVEPPAKAPAKPAASGRRGAKVATTPAEVVSTKEAAGEVIEVPAGTDTPELPKRASKPRAAAPKQKKKATSEFTISEESMDSALDILKQNPFGAGKGPGRLHSSLVPVDPKWVESLVVIGLGALERGGHSIERALQHVTRKLGTEVDAVARHALVGGLLRLDSMIERGVLTEEALRKPENAHIIRTAFESAIEGARTALETWTEGSPAALTDIQKYASDVTLPDDVRGAMKEAFAAMVKLENSFTQYGAWRELPRGAADAHDGFVLSDKATLYEIAERLYSTTVLANDRHTTPEIRDKLLQNQAELLAALRGTISDIDSTMQLLRDADGPLRTDSSEATEIALASALISKAAENTPPLGEKAQEATPSRGKGHRTPQAEPVRIRKDTRGAPFSDWTPRERTPKREYTITVTSAGQTLSERAIKRMLAKTSNDLLVAAKAVAEDPTDLAKIRRLMAIRAKLRMEGGDTREERIAFSFIQQRITHEAIDNVENYRIYRLPEPEKLEQPSPRTELVKLSDVPARQTAPRYVVRFEPGAHPLAIPLFGSTSIEFSSLNGRVRALEMLRRQLHDQARRLSSVDVERTQSPLEILRRNKDKVYAEARELLFGEDIWRKDRGVPLFYRSEGVKLRLAYPNATPDKYIPFLAVAVQRLDALAQNGFDVSATREALGAFMRVLYQMEREYGGASSRRAVDTIQSSWYRFLASFENDIRAPGEGIAEGIYRARSEVDTLLRQKAPELTQIDSENMRIAGLERQLAEQQYNRKVLIATMERQAKQDPKSAAWKNSAKELKSLDRKIEKTKEAIAASKRLIAELKLAKKGGVEDIERMLVEHAPNEIPRDLDNASAFHLLVTFHTIKARMEAGYKTRLQSMRAAAADIYSYADSQIKEGAFEGAALEQLKDLRSTAQHAMQSIDSAMAGLERSIPQWRSPLRTILHSRKQAINELRTALLRDKAVRTVIDMTSAGMVDAERTYLSIKHAESANKVVTQTARNIGRWRVINISAGTLSHYTQPLLESINAPKDFISRLQTAFNVVDDTMRRSAWIGSTKWARNRLAALHTAFLSTVTTKYNALRKAIVDINSYEYAEQFIKANADAWDARPVYGAYAQKLRGAKVAADALKTALGPLELALRAKTPEQALEILAKFKDNYEIAQTQATQILHSLAKDEARFRNDVQAVASRVERQHGAPKVRKETPVAVPKEPESTAGQNAEQAAINRLEYFVRSEHNQPFLRELRDAATKSGVAAALKRAAKAQTPESKQASRNYLAQVLHRFYTSLPEDMRRSVGFAMQGIFVPKGTKRLVTWDEAITAFHRIFEGGDDPDAPAEFYSGVPLDRLARHLYQAIRAAYTLHGGRVPKSVTEQSILLALRAAAQTGRQGVTTSAHDILRQHNVPLSPLLASTIQSAAAQSASPNIPRRTLVTGGGQQQPTVPASSPQPTPPPVPRAFSARDIRRGVVQTVVGAVEGLRAFDTPETTELADIAMKGNLELRSRNARVLESLAALGREVDRTWRADPARAYLFIDSREHPDPEVRRAAQAQLTPQERRFSRMFTRFVRLAGSAAWEGGLGTEHVSGSASTLGNRRLIGVTTTWVDWNTRRQVRGEIVRIERGGIPVVNVNGREMRIPNGAVFYTPSLADPTTYMPHVIDERYRLALSDPDSQVFQDAVRYIVQTGQVGVRSNVRNVGPVLWKYTTLPGQRTPVIAAHALDTGALIQQNGQPILLSAQSARRAARIEHFITAKATRSLSALMAREADQAPHLMTALPGNRRTSAIPFVGPANVERARIGFRLPAYMMEHPISTILHHIDRTNRRLAFVRAFGRDGERLVQLATQAAARTGRQEDAEAIIRYVRAIYGMPVPGGLPRRGVVTQLLNWSRSYVVASYLTGLATTAVQLSTGANTAALLGAGRSLRGALQALTDRQVLRRIRMAGIIDSTQMNILAMDDPRLAPNRIASTLMEVTGVAPIDRLMRYHAAATGRLGVVDMISYLAETPAARRRTSSTYRLLRDWFEYTDNDINTMIISYNSTGQVFPPSQRGRILESQAFYGGVKTQGIVSHERMPEALFRHPNGRWWFMLQTFAYSQMRMLNFAWKEALRGNPKPYLVLLLGFAATGYGKQKIEEYLKGKKSEKLTGSDLEKLLYFATKGGHYGLLEPVVRPILAQRVGASEPKGAAGLRKTMSEVLTPPDVKAVVNSWFPMSVGLGAEAAERVVRTAGATKTANEIKQFKGQFPTPLDAAYTSVMPVRRIVDAYRAVTKQGEYKTRPQQTAGRR